MFLIHHTVGQHRLTLCGSDLGLSKNGYIQGKDSQRTDADYDAAKQRLIDWYDTADSESFLADARFVAHILHG